jgi:hypothetical protein
MPAPLGMMSPIIEVLPDRVNGKKTLASLEIAWACDGCGLKTWFRGQHRTGPWCSEQLCEDCFMETWLLQWDIVNFCSITAESEERRQFEIRVCQDYKKYKFDQLGWHTWRLHQHGNFRKATPHPKIARFVSKCVHLIETFLVSKFSEKQVCVQQWTTNMLMWHGLMHALVVVRGR